MKVRDRSEKEYKMLRQVQFALDHVNIAMETLKSVERIYNEDGEYDKTEPKHRICQVCGNSCVSRSSKTWALITTGV